MTTKTTKITKATKTCPVCELNQDNEVSDCIRCGWDFSPLLGTPDQVHALLREKLDQARTTWRQRRYDPDLVPELERDPFETPDEFAVRLSERLWYVGEGELRKAEYDIETGRFPLSIRSPKTWATPWVDPSNSYSLCLPRDPARGLYQCGVIWPIYARLEINRSQVSLTALVLVVPDGELPVASKAAEDQTIEMPYKAPQAITGPLISGRYRDLGDGTLVDTRTGLQWMHCALGQSWDGRTCIGVAVSCNWDVLPGRVDTFNRQGGYGGHRDWRVPTIDELRTLVEKGSRNPATDRGVFPETRGWFLSSSPDANNSYRAWLVHFDSEGVHYSSMYHAGYVRLVRGRQ